MRAPSTSQIVPWVAGAVGAALVIGPGLNGRAWINLDQSVLPHLPLPTVLTGVGPDVPRRGAFTALGALASPWGGSAWVMKLVVIVLLAAATAGMARRLSSVGRLPALGAGLLYAFGPFLMGRLAVGHLGLLWAAAVLPWALPSLLDSARSPARAFRWSLLLAVGGYLSGTIVLALMPVLILAGRTAGSLGERVRGWAVVVAAQALWLVPGTAVAAAVGFNQPGGQGFRVSLSGLGAPARLLIGEGYFQVEAGSVPLPGAWGVVLGVAIGVLAAIGLVANRRRSPEPDEASTISRVACGWAGAVALAIGLLVPLSGLFEGTAELWADISAVQPFNLAREPHRLFLVAWLVLVPGVAWGAQWLGRRVEALEPLAQVLALAMALVLVAPQVWGMDGQLRGVELPEAWAEVRNRVRSDPGTVATAPQWSYAFYEVGDVRRSYNPWPDYLGVDTVISNDAGKGPTSESDPRMDTIGPALDAYRDGRRSSLVPALREAGIRWLVVPAVVQGRLFPSLGTQRGLEPVVEDPAVSLYRVTGGSDPTAADQVLWGLWRRAESTDATRPVVVDAAGPGWRAAGGTAPVDPGGRLVIPGGARWAWYPPSLITAISQVALLVAAMVSWRRDPPAREFPSKRLSNR
ncbi:MAG: hypothetical protein KDB24_12165 [Microthrixaceae bacterium]|nr:hypothetical protein [Microthrixaceae bacterium]